MPAHKRKPNYNGATTMQELLTAVCDYYGDPVDDRQSEDPDHIMKHREYGVYEKHVKRPQDFLCAALGIIVLSPVFVIVAILVKMNLGSPVI